MNEDDLYPFEVYEVFVNEAINKYLEPRLKTFRGEQKRQQEVFSAELDATRESMRAEFDGTKRGLQESIDTLSSKVIEMKVELTTVRHLAAINQAKIIHSASVSAGVNVNLLAQKYDAAIVEMRFSDDPLEVSDRFHQFCLDEGRKLGAQMIQPGLTALA